MLYSIHKRGHIKYKYNRDTKDTRVPNVRVPEKL